MKLTAKRDKAQYKKHFMASQYRLFAFGGIGNKLAISIKASASKKYFVIILIVNRRRISWLYLIFAGDIISMTIMGYREIELADGAE